MSAAVTNSDPVRNWPLWWFARLEAAIERGDFQTAARAQRELERLGVTVRYCGRHPAREEARNATDHPNGPAAIPQSAKTASPTTELAPLAVDIRGLATLLKRSVASLHRDNAAGRLPAAVKIGSGVRWIVRHVELWLEWGAPTRTEFAARLAAQRGGPLFNQHGSFHYG